MGNWWLGTKRYHSPLLYLSQMWIMGSSVRFTIKLIPLMCTFN